MSHCELNAETVDSEKFCTFIATSYTNYIVYFNICLLAAAVYGIIL